MTFRAPGATRDEKSKKNSIYSFRWMPEEKCSQGPRDAPFDRAWQEGFLEALTKFWPDSNVSLTALESSGDRQLQLEGLKFFAWRSDGPHPPGRSKRHCLDRVCVSGAAACRDCERGHIRVGELVHSPQRPHRAGAPRRPRPVRRGVGYPALPVSAESIPFSEKHWCLCAQEHRSGRHRCSAIPRQFVERGGGQRGAPRVLCGGSEEQDLGSDAERWQQWWEAQQAATSE